LIVPTNAIMDTIIQPVIGLPKRGSYRHHTVEFKREIVQQSLMPGASVSRIAREHNVNANQVFTWRKLFKEGQLGVSDAQVTLLPVSIAAPVKVAQPNPPSIEAAVPTGVIEFVIDKARLRIEGRADEAALTQILAHLLR
jgi:transposase